MEKLLNTLKEVTKDLKRKAITLLLVTKENGVVVAQDTVKIEKENIKNITIENNQIVIEYIPNYKAKRGLKDTVQIGFNLHNEEYCIIEGLRDGRTNISIDKDMYKSIDNTIVKATIKENKTEAKTMILYKSNFTGLREVTEDQKIKVSNNMRKGVVTMSGDELEKYINSKFIIIDTTKKDELYNTLNMLSVEYKEESKKSKQNFDKLLNNKNLVDKIYYMIKELEGKENPKGNKINDSLVNENNIEEVENMNKNELNEILESIQHFLKFDKVVSFSLNEELNEINCKYESSGYNRIFNIVIYEGDKNKSYKEQSLHVYNELIKIYPNAGIKENTEVRTVCKNDKREVIKIIKDNKFLNAHIENNIITVRKCRYDVENEMTLSKKELQELFPNVEINTKYQISYDGQKFYNEECTLIQEPIKEEFKEDIKKTINNTFVEDSTPSAATKTVQQIKTEISKGLKAELINKGYQTFELDILTTGDIQIKVCEYGGHNWNIALIRPHQRDFMLTINHDMNDSKNILCNTKNELFNTLNDYFSYHLQRLNAAVTQEKELEELKKDLYSHCYNIEAVNADIRRYNLTINQIQESGYNCTDILNDYIRGNKQKLVNTIEEIKHENNIYNLQPLEVAEVETDIIKGYWDSKINNYDTLVNDYKEKGIKYLDHYLNVGGNKEYFEVSKEATYKVNELMIFSNNDYNLLINNLMLNMKCIENKGGSDILPDGSYLNHVCILATNQNKDKFILIDPQGYNYARYIGIIEPEEANSIINNCYSVS